MGAAPCGFSKASTPAAWTKCVVQLSSFVLSLAICAITGAGPAAQPRRQPVIANFFEKVYRMTVRSAMPGKDVMDADLPA
jgi:hypothetical protein